MCIYTNLLIVVITDRNKTYMVLGLAKWFTCFQPSERLITPTKNPKKLYMVLKLLMLKITK
jgi:hypothetical protein